MQVKKYLIIFSILIFPLFLSSCQRQAGTYVWIDAPINNLELPLLQTVVVEGHASSPAGISKVEVYVDDELLSITNNPPYEGKLAAFQSIWTPTRPGAYTIFAVAYNTNNQSSEIDSIRIFFGIEPTEESPISTIIPTSTATEISTISATSTNSPTSTTTTTQTATATITLPPPTDTPTITPTPPDTTPPPIPSPVVPANGLSLSCRSNQSLSWYPVSDPSGIAQYHVNVQRSSDNTNWTNVAYSPILGLTDKTTQIQTECGWYYRWQVRAVDGAGNQGEWSPWSYFTIILE